MLKEKSQVSAAAPSSPPTAPPRMLLLQESSRWLSNWEGVPEGIANTALLLPMGSVNLVSLSSTLVQTSVLPRFHWCGRGNTGGLSVQQPCAVHLARPHGKAPGLRERRAAEGRWQHHLSSAGGQADLCPLGCGSYADGL